MSSEDRAKTVVAQWLMSLWVEPPSWLTTMPQEQELKTLTRLIAAELEK